ncbi:energy-coupling factor transporter transmembrane protein EcfT [Enterococcus faecium]|uniref:energy-coupling factor transporter transmembrane component T n=1 Tax=Enterococcus faecium TaxID=1352 RepID=UPI000DF2D88E|nr:energy-coupling factor transporter transmembrane component T [Enterococcus faecium]RCT64566.1 energy-coupling factor transporter transmembrane protein EcfT [Enterococcus faecium]
MSKINPLTLITLNIFFPVIIFLGKGNIFQVGCFIIATVLVLMFRKIKTCIYFILIYSVLFLVMKIIDAIKIEFFTIFFGTSLYIVFRMLPVVMISWLLVSVYTSNELLSSLEKIHLPKKIMLSITVVIRFFPTYRSEIRMIKESLKMRNIRLSFFQPLQYLEFLLVPVLIRATMIAEEMTANAITKGIESPVKRTSYYKTNMSLLDYIILFSVTIFFLSILI